jgi:hypothetical protein
MSETLTETFAHFAEEAEFRRWSEGRRLECRVVYVWQEHRIWKFMPVEWWKFVTKAIRNNGTYELPYSTELQGQGKRVAVENRMSGDGTIRCVDLYRWTVTNWSNELHSMCP